MKRSKFEIRNSKLEAENCRRSHSSPFRISNFGFRISSPPRSAFTLIELLVVVTLTLLVAAEKLPQRGPIVTQLCRLF